MRGTREVDVCVVGAGPAGLVLSAELVGHGVDVLLLESGSEANDPAAQALNEGATHGDPYVGLAATRQRGIGGTARMWNTIAGAEVCAKCVPLDPVDFTRRDDRPWSGWPFGGVELQGALRRALGWCGLSEDSFDADTWHTPRCAPLELPLPLGSGVYQLAHRRALLDEALRAVRGGAASGPVDRLWTGTTALDLESAGGRQVDAVVAATRDGSRLRIPARHVVLAGGAVENARLLLACGGGSGLGNASGLVGRCFMEHSRDASIVLRPRDAGFYRTAGFYDLHRAGDTWILGRLALEAASLRSHRLPNASGTLLPRVRPGVGRLRGLLGPAARVPGFSRLVPAGGHGWSRQLFPSLVYDGFTLLLNVEQLPHPENRITLTGERDVFGVPRAALTWRWRPEDRTGLERLRRIVAEALRESNLFDVDVRPETPIDPNAHHHAGTTRMHRDPASGVVDPNLRVHGVENLYVAGASVFPAAGFANPLLTILALSVRLADHLAHRS